MQQNTAEFERATRRRRHINEWISTAGRVVALVMLIAMGALWMVTGRIEPLLVATFGGIYSVAAGAAAFALLRKPSPQPPPVPDSTVGGADVKQA